MTSYHQQLIGARCTDKQALVCVSQVRDSTVCLQENLSYIQECIPVGCVPPACCPISQHALLGGCTWSQGGGVYLVLGGVPGPRGCIWCTGCTWSQGVYLVPGVYMFPGRVYLVLGAGDTWSGGCTWSWGCTWYQGGTCPEGVYLVVGGVPGLGGTCLGGVPAQRGVYLPRECTCLGGTFPGTPHL